MTGGAVKGITIQFNGDTTRLDAALREINNNTKALDRELKQVNNALKFNPGNVELWRQKQELLTQKVGETKNKLDALKQAQAQMDASGVDKNSKEYRELQREIVTTESKLKSMETELRKIGNANLKALSEQFKQVGDKAMEMGQNLSMKVTAPLVALGGVAVNKFAEVDKTMQLTNSTMGNTAEQAELLDKAMKDAAANSTFGMNDAATATLNFARAGLTAEQAASALAPAMNLAAGEGGELDTVSAGLVATINGFHGSFDEAATYADVFANACNNSALDVNSLSNAMSVAAPIFSAAGYTVNDAALYMGVMANNGIEADKAANSLKTGLARLISPAKQGAEMMADLGLYTDEGGSAFENLDGSMKSSVEIQKILHDSFSKLSESEQIAAASAIFGKNQMAPWLALINTAPSDVDKLSAALGEEGTTMNMANAMMSGFGGSLEKLKSSADVAATSLGEALAPIILKVAEGVQKLVDWFNNLSPGMQSTIAVILTLVAAIGPLLILFGALANGIGSIISLVGMMGGAIGAVSAGPLLLIVGAIAAVVAIGVTLYKHWDDIKAAAKKLGDTLKQVWNAIKTAISSAVNAVKNTVTSAWNSVKTTTSNVWNGIKSTITGVINDIKSAVSNAWNTIKSATSSAWTSIKDAIVSPFKAAKDKIDSIIDTITGWFPIDMDDFFGDIPTPHFSIDGEFSLDPLSVPSISVDWYAKGGIFDHPTLIGIGEAGPEAVVPLNKLWDKLDAMAEGGGAPVINVYATPGMDVNQLAMKIEQILVRQQRQRTTAYGI